MTVHRLLWLSAGLFLLAFVLRAAYLVFVTGAGTPLSGDMVDYHDIAVSFLEGNGWRDSFGNWSYRPPLISGMLTALYFVFGPSPVAARWLMVVISALGPIVLQWTTLHLTGKRSWAFVTALAWAFYPPSIFYATHVLTENAAVLLSILGLGTFLWAQSRRSMTIAALTGFLWGLATLNRPIHLLLPFALLAGQVVLINARGVRWLWPWKKWAIALAVFGVTLTPWTIRNYALHGHFMPTTSGLGWLMLMSNASLDHPLVQSGMYYKNPDLMAVMNRGSTEVERSQIGVRLALEEIRTNWTALPKALFNRAKNFWTFRPDPYDPKWTRDDWIMAIVWIPVLVLGAASFRTVSWRGDWPALIGILHAFVLTIPFWGTPRFRYPIDPFLWIRAVALLMAVPAWLNLRSAKSQAAKSADK